MKKADIGLIGLAVMGENLVMNMESKGFTVAVFNRTTEKVDKFVNGRAAGKNIIGCHSLEELVDNLEKPLAASTFIHHLKDNQKSLGIVYDDKCIGTNRGFHNVDVDLFLPVDVPSPWD